MKIPFDYDVVVIGGGGAGLTASKLARGFDKKVALVEKKKLGGECTWTGCVPSKALIKAASIAYHAKHLQTYGLSSAQEISLKTDEVMTHVRAMVERVYRTHTPDTLTKIGIDVLFGEPHFSDPNTIVVADKKITAKKIIITTGSQPAVPPIDGLDSVSYLTNQNLFDLKALPSSMIILGGGPIGAEMASAFNRLGTKITLVEMQDRILPREDEELVAILTDALKKEGVDVQCGMKATNVRQQDGQITLACFDKNNATHQFQAKHILVAVGRRPNIEGLGLEKAGVETTRRGIMVNAYLQTTAKHIYAAGDVVGPFQFSHMAHHQAVAATRSALLPRFIPVSRRMDYRHVSWATFTAPELASAGMIERDARERFGDRIRVYRHKYSELDRAVIDGHEIGMGKFITDHRGRFVGAHILGERAGELISEVQIGKTFGKRFGDFYSVIHPYPTYTELIWHAAKKRYIDRMHQNVLVKLLWKLFGSKK